MFTALLSSLVLSSSFALIFSYNVDTDYPIVHVDPEAGKSNYFGYSVALRSRGNGASYSSLFVGAPRSADENGVVYRCILSPIDNPSNSSCQQLTINSTMTYVRVADPQRSIDVYRVGNNGWLGASMATGEFSDFTACAPQSQITFRNNDQLSAKFIHDMRGLCYDLPNGLGNSLHRDNAILKSYEFPLTDKIHAVYGFSVNYPVRKVPNTVERIIGKPRINAVEIAHKNAKEERSQNASDLSYLGYSLASGYFFKHDQILFVAGAPAAHYKGMVVVYEPASDNQTIIPGSVFGEYFGSSLAAGDFDGNGLDEIAVGAPHWGEVDYGRVYIFSANNERTDFKEGLMLQGAVHHAMFGYTLTAGDLDSDGFSDLVVSAPWEGASGIVYIFYGNRNFGIRGSSTPVSQRIEPSKFASPLSVERFGFALSPPVDVDENGYPDLAIGAFKSGKTVLLRSKPVIDTKITLTSDPVTLEKSTQTFRVIICVVYSGGKQTPSRQELKLDVTINEIDHRVEGELSKIFKVLLTREQRFCTNLTVQLKKEITNYVDPIVIDVKHDTVDSGLSGNKFCPACAVLSKRSLAENSQLIVPFNTGCKNGTVCNSRLSVGWAFDSVINNDEWIVGSGDVDLNLRISNQGEPAYLTQLRIQFPPGTKLRKTVPSCVDSQENTIFPMVICDIGNPLVNGEDKALKIGIGMGQLSESAGGTVLYFVVSITTRSVNLDPNPTQFIVLKLKNEASVALTGIIFGVGQDFGRAGNRTKVSFRHAYRVRKFGSTPVREALMAIDVPVATTEKNISFVDIRVPEVNSYGKIYECSIIETKEARLKVLSGFVDPVKPRLLRSVSEDTVESDQQLEETTEETTETNLETIDNQRGNGTLVEQSGSSQIPMKIIYMNCSMDSIICATVVCRFSLLKTSEDMGNLLLNMTLDAAVFSNAIEDVSATIKFSTNATVQIISPILKPEDNTHRAYANASTMLYNVPEQQPLAEWILPGSIGVGVLLFIILAVILLKVGFFKRPKLEETARARETEMILNVQDESNEDPFG